MDPVMLVPRNAGNHNEGQVYERKVLLFIAASLSQNEDVDDFWLVSNPIGVDKFDDVIVKVSFKDNRKNIAIFIQVKHTETDNKSLWLNGHRSNKRKPKNPCEINLQKYERSFDEVMCIKSNNQPENKQLRESKLLEDVHEEDYFMCIFTNIREVIPTLQTKHFDRSHPISFLGTSTFGEYRDYIFHSSNTNQTYQRKQLFIFLGQPNVDNIDYAIANLLENTFINKLVVLDKTVKEYMQRGNDCAILTRRAFEIEWLKVLLEDWLLDDLGQVEEIDPKFRELWCQIFSIQQIVNLPDDKTRPLLTCYYEYVVCKKIDINFNWRTGVTESTANMIKENYGANVTNIRELLTLLWCYNEIPLPIKPEHTQNILEFVDKFKTVGRRFVVFSGDESDDLITDLRHISEIDTLKEALKVEVSVQGRLPVALSTICEGTSMEKEEAIRSAVDGIFGGLKLSQLLAWTKSTAPGNENQHVIGPILPRPDNKYITRNFILKQEENNEEEQNQLTEAAVINHVKPGLHIITGEPGMGKSTVLQALAHGYTSRNFVIHVQLRDCLDDIENPATLQNIESDPIKYFFDKMTSNTDDKIAKSIMEVHRTNKRLCLFLDAFDEILPLHGMIISSLMATIIDNTDVPIFCTTRPHAEEKITSRPGTLFFELLPFDRNQIAEYFAKTNISDNIRWRFDYEFLSNPLHLHMISQIHDDHENRDSITRGEMYKLFIELKHTTYNKKMNLNLNVAYLSIVKSMKQHRVLALVEIFGEKSVTTKGLISDTGLAKILNDLCDQNIGIVDVRNSKKSFLFVHRTFAEYFVADWLLNNMVQSVSNTERCKPFYKAVWHDYGHIKRMIDDRIRDCNLWYEARKYFFINSDNKNKASPNVVNGWRPYHKNIKAIRNKIASVWRKPIKPTPCTCDGFEGWLKCTVSHPNVNGSTIVHSINMDYPIHTRLTKNDGDICIKLLRAIDDENKDAVETNLAPPLLETGMGIVAFKLAITTGNESIVKILLNRRPTLVDDQDVNGNTGLHISCALGYCSIAALLFERSANFDIRNNEDRTPLGMAIKNNQWGIWNIKHIGEISKRAGEDRLASSEKHFSTDLSQALLDASQNKKWDIVKQLIEYGAEPTLSDTCGYTPMHYASETGELEIIKMLLLSKRGFNVNEETFAGETPLILACKWGNIDTAMWLIEHGADLALADNRSCTCMHYAAKGGQSEVAKMLLERGVNVNEKANDSETPLAIACDERQWDIVKLLLENGADLTVPYKNGRTLMHFAAYNGLSEIAKILLERGLNVNEETNDGKTSLTIACHEREWDIVKWLLENGADLTVSDENGWTLLHFAAYYGLSEIAQILLERGVNVNKKENDGKTPLSIACDYGELDIVKRLLDHHADLTLADKYGWTPMHFVAKRHWVNCIDRYKLQTIKVMLDKRPNINMKTKSGQTPLAIARSQEWTDVVELLLAHGADES